MKRIRRCISLMVATVALFAVPVAAAQADPFELDITDAVLDLGGLSGVKAIDSSIPDPPATLDGTLTGQTVSIPKAGFVFPTKSAEITGGITADIDMSANEDITGTYDSSTGALTLDVNLKAVVAIPSFSSTCVISPIDMELTTSSTNPYLGEAFDGGLAAPGAVSASWNGLPPVTGGGLCSTVAGLIAGPGGIWMAQDISEPKTCADAPSDSRCNQPPTIAPVITEGPTGEVAATTANFAFSKGDGETVNVSGFQCKLDSGAFEACDAGTKAYAGLSEGEHTFEVKATNVAGEGPTASRTWKVKIEQPVVKVGKFGSVSAKLKPKKVKRRKKATITVKVKNIGEAAIAGTQICIKAPAKLVKVKKCTKVGSLAAGKTVTKKIAVKAKKKRGTAKLTVTVSGKGVVKKTAKAKLKIR